MKISEKVKNVLCSTMIVTGAGFHCVGKFIGESFKTTGDLIGYGFLKLGGLFNKDYIEYMMNVEVEK